MIDIRKLARYTTVALVAALAATAIAPAASATTVSVHATDDAICVTGGGCFMFYLPAELPLVAHGEASVSASEVCPAAPCGPNLRASYYGYAYYGSTGIVVGPGPNPPPPCGFTCPNDVVRWVRDQLP